MNLISEHGLHDASAFYEVVTTWEEMKRERRRQDQGENRVFKGTHRRETEDTGAAQTDFL